MSGASTDFVIAPDGAFTAPLRLEYPYSRTVGPTYGRFFDGLLEDRVEGTVTASGHVFVPPVEFDPVTGEALTAWVTVANEGEVISWSWQPKPYEGAPFDHPFAWALVKLDGASTAMLHGVDCSLDEMSTGMRVRVRWASELTPGIGSIACFEPVSTTGQGA